MKNTTSRSILIGCALLMIISCDPKEKSTDTEKAVSRLENYVDSVETATKVGVNHNWNKIDMRYRNLRSEAEKAYGLSDDKSRVTQLESRYESIKASTVKNAGEIKNNAERHLEKVENWWANASSDVKSSAKNTGDDIESGVKESMDWLEENFENLGENLKTRYQKIKNEIKDE